MSEGGGQEQKRQIDLIVRPRPTTPSAYWKGFVVAYKCGACSSGHVQVLADNYRCLSCGEYTDFDGEPGARVVTGTHSAKAPHTT